MSAELTIRLTDEQLRGMEHAKLLEHAERLEAMRKVRSLESFLGWDGFGGSDMYYRMLKDRFGNGEFIVPPNVASDRKSGANKPLILTEVQLDFIRQRSMILVQVNPYGIGMHENQINYLVGKGFSYKVKPRDAIDDDGLPQKIDRETKKRIRQVQKWTDNWIAVNRWSASARDPRTMQAVSQPREREAVDRTLAEGEGIVRIHLLPDGESAARFVEPVQVVNEGLSELEGWTYGMRHRTEPFVDVETIEEYCIRYWDERGTQEPETVPADQIIHFKMQRSKAAIKRGVPFYSFGVADALDRALNMQDVTSRTGAFRAGNAEYWASDTGIPTGGNMTAYGGAGSGGSQFVIDKFAPPPRVRYMSGRTPVTPTAIGWAEYLEILQSDLRQAATAACATEAIVSADASNNNYASMKEAGTPWVLSNAVGQEHFVTGCLAVIYRAMRWAIECGKLPPDTLDLIELHAETIKDDSRQPLERAQEDQISTGGKAWKSPQTAMRERGLDPEQQFREMDEFNERYGNQGQPLDPNADPYAQPKMESLPPYQDASTHTDPPTPTMPEHLKAIVDKLPAPVRVPLQKTHAALMVGHHVALAVAKKVAQERGLTPEQTDALAKRLGHYDLMFSGGAKAAALAGLHAAAPLAAVPAASLGYLTYSTARDPMATVRAATKGIQGVLDRRKKATDGD